MFIRWFKSSLLHAHISICLANPNYNSPFPLPSSLGTQPPPPAPSLSPACLAALVPLPLCRPPTASTAALGTHAKAGESRPRVQGADLARPGPDDPWTCPQREGGTEAGREGDGERHNSAPSVCSRSHGGVRTEVAILFPAPFRLVSTADWPGPLERFLGRSRRGTLRGIQTCDGFLQHARYVVIQSSSARYCVLTAKTIFRYTSRYDV